MQSLVDKQDPYTSDLFSIGMIGLKLALNMDVISEFYLRRKRHTTSTGINGGE